MPNALHQLAPADLTPEQVLSTIALIDDECSHAQAEMIAEAVNCQRGNLTRACPGWHQSYYGPFLAYANALLCERDPAEHAAWLTTCAGDAERRGHSAEAADYRRRAAEIAHTVTHAMFASCPEVALIGERA